MRLVNDDITTPGYAPRRADANRVTVWALETAVLSGV